MKQVAKLVMMGLVIVPVAFFVGCGKKCNDDHQRLHKMKKEHGGK